MLWRVNYLGALVQLILCKRPQLHDILICLDWLGKVWVFIFLSLQIFNSVSIHSQKYLSLELGGMTFSQSLAVLCLESFSPVTPRVLFGQLLLS